MALTFCGYRAATTSRAAADGKITRSARFSSSANSARCSASIARRSAGASSDTDA